MRFVKFPLANYNDEEVFLNPQHIIAFQAVFGRAGTTKITLSTTEKDGKPTTLEVSASAVDVQTQIEITGR
ncbi:hypothetical protein [Rhizobium leguminosarum]|uniref:hypothetical protein n=1 Tax=Rhizobium leguminosarum TaxID=384 RepID=UPI001C9286E0|nr:hypothetical protein [Rhizobium leguminosarum]MBY2910576.1 hypothetical protein [Rhizobium leguminosarum]MBY2950389.1 hypothetical protein [Rhizobium leguminosarum]